MFDKLKQKMNEKVNTIMSQIELPTASEHVRNSRLEICRSCELLRPTEFCKSCNCYMPAKTWIAGTKCPEGKWGAAE